MKNLIKEAINKLLNTEKKDYDVIKTNIKDIRPIDRWKDLKN